MSQNEARCYMNEILFPFADTTAYLAIKISKRQASK